ncbi:MAG: helix-turn-helix transcriptional regulator [Pseudomonadales bacterium]|nr:helix-turn-helix transcriptional regulator [Pseudomonadales bacterium]
MIDPSSLSNGSTIHRQNASFAREVIAKSKASAAAIFLYDKSQASPVNFLYETGIPASITALYTNGVYRDDPMLQYSTSPERDCHRFTGTNYCQRLEPNLEPYQEHNDRYWHALGRAGFRETATSLKAVSRDIYLVVGLLLAESRSRKGAHLCVENAMTAVDNWLEACHHAIVDAAVRQCFFPPRQPQLKTDLPAEANRVTNREWQVIAELMAGCSNKQISAKLGVAEHTVENHLKNIYKKFAVRSRTALIAKITSTP